MRDVCRGVSSSKFKLTIPRANQITNLFLSFPRLPPLARVCSYPLSPFYFLSLFKWRESPHISLASPLLPTILACSPTTYTPDVPKAQRHHFRLVLYHLPLPSDPALVLPRLRRRFSPSLRWSQHLFSCTGKFSRTSTRREPRLGI